MEARILQQDKLLKLLDVLAQEHEVIAPRDDALSDGTTYGEVSSASEVYLGDKKPVKSLKGFFSPEREVLLEYQLGREPRLGVPTAGDRTRVIFGARPCDASAFPIVDKVFAWDYLDSSYLEARERAVIISLACENPCETCFCVSLGGSPVEIEGSDLLLTPLKDVYHVQIVTERGKAFVDKYQAFFEASDPAHDREVVLFEERARAKITKHIDLQGLHESLDFDDPVWETLAPQCIDCGICTFLCPTCHCFDIQDEGSTAQGERVRLWDACTFYNYTKAHAGQPRPTHYRRYRQRILHKFRYYPENFGRTLCVGCGRCIEYCPVNIDLREVLRRAGATRATASAAAGERQE
jgi:sulfhydrogenase subunit beta (sulfur reductase)